MSEVIVRDGKTGNAIVSSTGTPVDSILAAIESTGTVEGALRLDPELTPDAVAAALRFARVAVGREVRYVPDPNLGVSTLREISLHPYRAGHRGESVTVDAGTYEQMLARLEFLERNAEPEIEFGMGGGRSGGAAELSIEDSIRSADARSEELRYELDLVESIRDGLQDVLDGNVIPHEEVVARLRARFPG
jgi:uncharacterized protein (DUF433 family)